MPTVATYTVPTTAASVRYLTEVSATLERDSANRVLQERVATRGVITLSAQRDSLGNVRASGTVDSFTVRGLENVLTPAPPTDARTGKPLPIVPAAPSVPLSVQFDAVLDQRMLRITTRPPLANECDRPETGATNLVREVIVRVPRTLSVGLAWRDSAVSVQCRLNVPITLRTKAEYVVERAEQHANRTELVVRRTVDTQFDGETRSTWRNVSLSGAGKVTQVLRIDAGTGVVRSIDGDGQLTVRLSDSSRRDASGMQVLRQKTTSRTIVRP